MKRREEGEEGADYVQERGNPCLLGYAAWISVTWVSVGA